MDPGRRQGEGRTETGVKVCDLGVKPKRVTKMCDLYIKPKMRDRDVWQRHGTKVGWPRWVTTAQELIRDQALDTTGGARR